MDHRERFIAAARRRPVDRIPTQFRALKVLARRLMAHFGIDPDEGLSAAEALLECLGADFWASGSRPDAWATFIPAYLGPQPQAPYLPDPAGFFMLGIPAVRGGVDELGFEYLVYADPPLARVERASDLPMGWASQRLEHFDFSMVVNRQANAPVEAGHPLSVESLAGRDHHVVCMGNLNNPFMICCYLRGMEQFLVDMVHDRALAERLVGEVGEFCLEYARRYLAGFGAQADVYASWDDVAGQDGILFSPALFRRYFQPIYRDLIAEVKRNGLIYSWHCCGSVHQVLPMMIEAGIDVLDVVQTSARDMDLGTVHRLYGRDICVHGGIDVQVLLVSGTPAQVRDEVRRARDLWGTRGGIVLGPSHEAMPETPIENILAIYDAGLQG